MSADVHNTKSRYGVVTEVGSYEKPTLELNEPDISGLDIQPEGLDTKDSETKLKFDPNSLVYDQGYCWVVCGVCALLNFNTWGMNSGFAIYFSYYLNNDTFEGASNLDYAAIGGLAFGAALTFCPLLTYLQGMMGTRNTIILGNCIQFTALMLASFSRKLWQLYLTQGLLQSLGLALISLPALTILPLWFKKRRVLAGGLATAGAGAGGIVYNLGMQALVDAKSVYWALRSQAIISFGLVWVCILLFRDRSKHHSVQFRLFDKNILFITGFWLTLLYVIFCMFGYVIVLYTVANYTTSLGYTERQGSVASAMVQLGSLLLRPLVGFAADYFGAITVAFAAYSLSAIFVLAMWIPARNYATVLIFSIVIGGIMGSVYGTFGAVLARLVGIKKMNIAYGMLWTFMGISGIASPVMGVSLVKHTTGPSQYIYCSLFAGLSFVVSAICLFLLRGFVQARDKVVASDNDTSHGLTDTQNTLVVDHDTQDTLSIKVPFGLMMKECFTFKNKL